MGILDDAVRRQQERRDPLGRLPWPARLAGLLLLTALAVAQIVLGSGASKVIGVGLLLLVVPPQAIATWASWTVARNDRA